MEVILSRLSHCVSKDLADELALNFCFINTKINRRRLVRGLCDVPRAALQLVPFYSRIIATTGSVFPDIPSGEHPRCVRAALRCCAGSKRLGGAQPRRSGHARRSEEALIEPGWQAGGQRLLASGAAAVPAHMKQAQSMHPSMHPMHPRQHPEGPVRWLMSQ